MQHREVCQGMGSHQREFHMAAATGKGMSAQHKELPQGSWPQVAVLLPMVRQGQWNTATQMTSCSRTRTKFNLREVKRNG